MNGERCFHTQLPICSASPFEETGRLFSSRWPLFVAEHLLVFFKPGLHLQCKMPRWYSGRGGEGGMPPSCPEQAVGRQKGPGGGLAGALLSRFGERRPRATFPQRRARSGAGAAPGGRPAARCPAAPAAPARSRDAPRAPRCRPRPRATLAGGGGAAA